MRSLLLLMLIPCTIATGAEAKLTGPDTWPVDKLFSLDASGSSVDDSGFHRVTWVTLSSDFQSGTGTCRDKLFGQANKPGVYTFLFVAVDEVSTAVASHTITITADGEVPEEPEEPEEPDRPSPELTYLRELSRMSANSVGDPRTAKQLADAIRAVSAQATLAGTQLAMRTASETVMANRVGDADWFSNWRVPINAAVDRLQVETPAEFIEAFGAIADGLDAVKQAAPEVVPSPVPDRAAVPPAQSETYVIMYTQQNCPPCEDWKLVESPQLGTPYREEYRLTPDIRVTPSFRVVVDGVPDTMIYQGKTPAATLLHRIRTLGGRR